MIMIMKLTRLTKTQGVDCSICFVVVYEHNFFPSNRYAARLIYVHIIYIREYENDDQLVWLSR